MPELSAQTFIELKDRILRYFMHLVPFQQYSWMSIAAGFLLITLALILW